MSVLGFILIIFSIVLAATIILFIKGINFTDVLVSIFTALLALSFDMIFCKQLATYHYVSYDYIGINSLIVGLLVFPSLWIIFISLKPKNIIDTIFYIVLWSAGLTALEIFIAKPYKIVLYPKWDILPWSPIVYIISFLILIGYKKILENKLKKYYIN